MEIFAARIYQALGLLQGLVARLEADGELHDEDLAEIVKSIGCVLSAIEYELELRSEARSVADDTSAARKEC